MDWLRAEEQRESERRLLDPGDSAAKEADSEDQHDEKRKAYFWESRPIGILSLVVMVSCTVLNIYFWAESRALASPRTSLRRPSPYIGLENAVRNLTDEAALHFATVPPILTQVSRQDPRRVWPDDTKQELRRVGTVSPDARHLVVSPEVSSIAQFRAIDYGFESCSIQFNMKSPTQSALSIEPQPVSINVWLLEESPRIDVRQLSWSTKPPRKRLLDTVELSRDSVATTQSIKCPWGSFPAFEFSCEQDGCLVDFWQNPKVSELGKWNVFISPSQDCSEGGD